MRREMGAGNKELESGARVSWHTTILHTDPGQGGTGWGHWAASSHMVAHISLLGLGVMQCTEDAVCSDEARPMPQDTGAGATSPGGGEVSPTSSLCTRIQPLSLRDECSGPGAWQVRRAGPTGAARSHHPAPRGEGKGSELGGMAAQPISWGQRAVINPPPTSTHSAQK